MPGWNVRHEKITVRIDGTTGTGVSATPLFGMLNAVYIAYGDTVANTTNVAIKCKSDGLTPEMPLLTVSNYNVNRWYYPRAAVVDNTNVVISGAVSQFMLNCYVQVDVTQSTDTETVDVVLMFEG